jgi:hypothetical protein
VSTLTPKRIVHAVGAKRHGIFFVDDENNKAKRKESSIMSSSEESDLNDYDWDGEHNWIFFGSQMLKRR